MCNGPQYCLVFTFILVLLCCPSALGVRVAHKGIRDRSDRGRRMSRSDYKVISSGTGDRVRRVFDDYVSLQPLMACRYL